MLDLSKLKNDLKFEVQRLGFSHLGVAPALPAPRFDEFANWVEAGYHADMGYLSRADTLAKRKDPRLILEGCQCVISLAYPYQPHHASPKKAPEGFGRISSYALNQDYHITISSKLSKVTDFITTKTNGVAHIKTYVDFGPVLERGFASLAGLGFQGKNSCLIIPGTGSYFFLAEILIDLPLPMDEPFTRDFCGSCRRCIDACPTQCILPDRTIDAGRCISYLTIENKGVIPDDLKEPIGDWFFGCDVCQAVCPHNAKVHKQAFLPQESIFSEFIDLISLFELDEQEFIDKFKNTALQRPIRAGLIRNAAIVIGNQAYRPALPALEKLLAHEQNPIIREACEWAINKIQERED